MLDAIAHPAGDIAAATLARELAARLNLRLLELPRPSAAASLDAALAVAPVNLKLSRTPATPVVVLTPVAAAAPPIRGSCIVCGVRDDDDSVCAAIAGALAERLGLPLMFVHVVSQAARASGGKSVPPPPATGRPADHRAAARETISRVARAAGLDRPESAGIRVVRGAAGRTLAATARRESAALVVVSESARRLLQRALHRSATGYLVRRCQRPVVVCPRDPAAAMRLREALAPTSNREARRS